MEASDGDTKPQRCWVLHARPCREAGSRDEGWSQAFVWLSPVSPLGALLPTPESQTPGALPPPAPASLARAAADLHPLLLLLGLPVQVLKPAVFTDTSHYPLLLVV